METYSPVLSSAIPPKVKLYNEAQHVSPTMTTELQPRVTAMSHKLQWDTLQQRRAYSRVLMLYRIRNGLVAIPASIYLQPTVAHTRGFETSYKQTQCNTSMYNQSFFPSAIILWNTLPVDVCQLPPASFGSTEHHPADATADRPYF